MYMYFCNFIVYGDCHICYIHVHTKYASTYMYVEWLISVTRICIKMNFFILWLLWYNRLIMILSESTYFTVFGEDVIFMGKCFYLLLNKEVWYTYTCILTESRKVDLESNDSGSCCTYTLSLSSSTLFLLLKLLQYMSWSQFRYKVQRP